MLSMSSLAIKYLIPTFLVLITIVVHRTSGQECICNVKFVGEYCGTGLNEKSDTGTSNCSRELIYFCGKGNMRKQAIHVRSCTEKGFECTKSNKDNPCFQNLYCQCSSTHTRKKKYCGSDLIGAGCKPNIVYKCPMFRGNKINVEDACPDGCKDGRCV